MLILKASKSVKAADFTDDGWSTLQSTNTPSAFEKRFADNNYRCWVCEIDGEVVGYLAMTDNEKIDHMFVLAEHRQKGICRKLWSIAKKHCEDSNAGDYFWVRSSSYAEPVYESFGFRALGSRKSSNGISFQLMEYCKNHS